MKGPVFVVGLAVVVGLVVVVGLAVVVGLVIVVGLVLPIFLLYRRQKSLAALSSLEMAGTKFRMKLWINSRPPPPQKVGVARLKAIQTFRRTFQIFRFQSKGKLFPQTAPIGGTKIESNKKS